MKLILLILPIIQSGHSKLLFTIIHKSSVKSPCANLFPTWLGILAAEIKKKKKERKKKKAL